MDLACPDEAGSGELHAGGKHAEAGIAGLFGYRMTVR